VAAVPPALRQMPLKKFAPTGLSKYISLFIFPWSPRKAHLLQAFSHHQDKKTGIGSKLQEQAPVDEMLFFFNK
jgi:hypothetical protein